MSQTEQLLAEYGDIAGEADQAVERIYGLSNFCALTAGPKRDRCDAVTETFGYIHDTLDHGVAILVNAVDLMGKMADVLRGNGGKPDEETADK